MSCLSAVRTPEGQVVHRCSTIPHAADGWLVPEREGRYTWWRLSPAFEEFLHRGAEKIFGFTTIQASWDRRWLVVVTGKRRRGALYLACTRSR